MDFDEGLWWVCLGKDPDTNNDQWVEVERTDQRVINFLHYPEDNHGSEAAIAYRHGFDSEMNTHEGDNNNNSGYDSEMNTNEGNNIQGANKGMIVISPRAT